MFFRDGQEGVFQRSGGSVFTRGSVFADIVRGTFRQRGSIHHDEHVIAKFRFSQEVRRDDDGDAFFRQGVDAQPEVAPGQGVRSGSGFVQKKDVRGVEQGARHAEALLVAAGQVRGGGVHVRSQVEFFFHGADGFLPLLSGHAVGSGEEFQVLTRGQHAVHGKFLGHVSNFPARSGGGGPQIRPGHIERAAAGGQQPAEHAESGAFPRSVGAQKAEDLPFADGEADVVDGNETAEFPDEVRYPDDGAAVFRPLRFRRSGRGGDVLRGEVHLVGKQGHEAVREVRLRGGGVVFLQLFPCGVAVGNDDADGVSPAGWR